MKLLIIVINNPDNVENILEVLLELDVRGAVCIETEGVMQLLVQEVPIFGGLRQLLASPKAHNKTVFGITDDDDIIAKLDKMLKRIGVDMTAPDTGYAILLPISDSLVGEEE
ncbi:MAG: hypothetical protein QGD94_06160 [Planctomycetia bacterium]|nr:hypothetical protein [Planctomycetia bacterium]